MVFLIKTENTNEITRMCKNIISNFSGFTLIVIVVND